MVRSLSIDDVKKILRVAEEKNQRNALVFKLLAWYGFELGEVVGSPSRLMVSKKWIPKEPTHEGLQIQDLAEDGIVARRNDGAVEKRSLTPEVVRDIRDCIGDRIEGKIFEISEDRVRQLVKEYAKDAGLSDPKKIRPHMLQDFYEGHRADIPHLSSTFRAIEPEHYVGERIDLPGLTYAPINEQGVVFLFGMICHHMDVIVEHIQQGFPDAEAIDYRHNRSRGIRRRIEFEFRSSGFTKGTKKDKHHPTKCDIIICWEHDWKKCPARIEVIALKSRIAEIKALILKKAVQW